MDQFKITGFIVVVGAGGGIGKEVAFTFAEAGVAGILLADIRYEAAAQCSEESKRLATNPDFRCVCTDVDVVDSRSVHSMVELAIREFGRIDHCINAAGVDMAAYLPITAASEDDFDRVVGINAKGAFLLSKALIQKMERQDPVEINLKRHGTRNLGRGSIVHIASALSVAAAPAKVSYTTSKHALLGVTRAASVDCKEAGIRVNLVSPIWVQTPMFEEECRRFPPTSQLVNKYSSVKRPLEADEVASACLYLCSPSAVHITGMNMLLDAGATTGPVM